MLPAAPQMPLPASKAGLPARNALPVIVGNSESCRVAYDRLTGLQLWVRSQGLAGGGNE